MLKGVCVVLALVVVAGTVAAVFWALEHDRARAASRDRAQAVAVASQFALRMDQADGEQFDAYIKKVTALLTTKAKTKNDEGLKQLKPLYEQTKIKGSGKVLMTAVGASDASSATVLVVHDASATSTQGKVAHHYRWSVALAKVDGRWLVDDFTPVN